MAEATKTSVLRHFDELAGRKNYFELREVETVDNGTVTQVISAGGSLVAQVNATGQDALDRLSEGTGAEVIDTGDNPKESVEDNKVFTSKQGTPAFPTQPETIDAPAAVTEVDNTDKRVFSEQTTDRTENQASVKTEDQRSNGTASDV